jgi:transcriptional regulator
VPQGSDQEKVEELLQTLIVLEMFKLGATQQKIAKVVGKSKGWVNAILKDLTRPAGREV